MANAKIRIPKKSTSSKTVRQISTGAGKSRKIPKIKLPKKVQSSKKFFGKSYHLPLPDNRLGNILSKRVRIFPKYIKNSLVELRQVDWPNRKLTINLSFAVMIFAIVFGLFVTIIDYGLDKVFKEVILKK